MSKNWDARGSAELAETGTADEHNMQGNMQVAVHVGFAVSMLAFVILYARDYLSLITFWANSGLFQYALLIFPIAAVLVWARRDWLARVAARPRPIALWGVVAIGGLWLLGAAAEINLFKQIAMVVIWPLMVYVFYGPRVARILAFALGYLLFAIPLRDFVMEFMVEPLQTITAHLAVFALRLSDVPVFMQGHFIDTPVTTWHVAEACSGIKFFVATMAFGVLYAHLFYNSLRRRLIFIGFALIVPIIANALRVYFTILIGEYLGLQYATGTDHLVFGWQFFGTVLVLLFLGGMPWHQPPPRPPLPDVGLPEDGSRRMRWVLPLALALVVLPVTWYTGTGWLANHAHITVSTHLPEQLAGYSMVDQGYNGNAEISDYRGDTHLSWRYGDSLQPIQVDYLGIHVGMGGPEITNLSAWPYDADKWRIVGGPTTVQAGTDGHKFTALELAAWHGDDRRRLVYAYRIGSRWITSPLRFKAWKTWDRLIGNPAPAGIMIVSSTGQTSPARLADIAGAAALALPQPHS